MRFLQSDESTLLTVCLQRAQKYFTYVKKYLLSLDFIEAGLTKFFFSCHKIVAEYDSCLSIFLYFNIVWHENPPTQ